jgi:hypothetical protein
MIRVGGRVGAGGALLLAMVITTISVFFFSENE